MCLRGAVEHLHELTPLKDPRTLWLDNLFDEGDELLKINETLGLEIHCRDNRLLLHCPRILLVGLFDGICKEFIEPVQIHDFLGAKHSQMLVLGELFLGHQDLGPIEGQLLLLIGAGLGIKHLFHDLLCLWQRYVADEIAFRKSESEKLLPHQLEEDKVPPQMVLLDFGVLELLICCRWRRTAFDLFVKDPDEAAKQSQP